MVADILPNETEQNLKVPNLMKELQSSGSVFRLKAGLRTGGSVLGLLCLGWESRL